MIFKVLIISVFFSLFQTDEPKTPLIYHKDLVFLVGSKKGVKDTFITSGFYLKDYLEKDYKNLQAYLNFKKVVLLDSIQDTTLFSLKVKHEELDSSIYNDIQSELNRGDSIIYVKNACFEYSTIYLFLYSKNYVCTHTFDNCMVRFEKRGF